MSNNWFQFKQFIIQQSGAAMKVGTDGVLLGSWARLPDSGKKALDIGTGSGLIALMLAQRYAELFLTGIDIDENACKQAKINVNESPWHSRIQISNISLQKFTTTYSEKFDLIISNPPFFANSLKPGDKARSHARHQDTLNPEDLMHSASKLLNPGKGLFCIILPYEQKKVFLSSAENQGLSPSRIMNIRPNPGKDFKRIMIEFSFTKTKTEEKEMVIELARHSYSKEYVELTKDFYLNGLAAARPF